MWRCPLTLRLSGGGGYGGSGGGGGGKLNLRGVISVMFIDG